jgi:hypothetical protein
MEENREPGIVRKRGAEVASCLLYNPDPESLSFQ